MDLQRLVDQLNKELEKIRAVVNRNAAAINKTAKAVDRLVAQSRHDQQLDDVLKTVASAYSNARAYNNVVIVAGYAAFFAMWGFLHNDIPRPASLWALLLMMISAIAFVFWEVGKMIWLSWRIKKNAEAMLDVDDPVAKFQEAQTQEEREAITAGKIWVYQVAVTVCTALGAIGVLGWNLVQLVFSPAP